MTRVERPIKSSRHPDSADPLGEDEDRLPPGEDDEYDEPPGELIDESESEAAPAAID